MRVRIDARLGVLPAGVSELGLRVAEAAALELSPTRVLIVENLATYLAAPLPAGGVVVWGHGFDAGRLGRMPWLTEAGCVQYWGDLDTHGFAILNLVRSQVPQVTSVLMDRETLLHHRDRWVAEPKPTRADLAHLDGAERTLYEDLVEGCSGRRCGWGRSGSTGRGRCRGSDRRGQGSAAALGGDVVGQFAELGVAGP